ncbi:MAG: MarR family transcriptional regulator, partial [Rhizobiales bacterium]|nr:MarR family transcriptional regulator [Hyphomicrobiales bacterium]
MISAARAVETVAKPQSTSELKPLYMEAVTLVERLHRRLLDVVKDEFDREGRSDINSTQALLL